MNRISTHLRSNVVGYVALFIALSGTAYAIDGPLPGTDQVGSADIINDEVTDADVRDDTLAGGGLRAIDLRASSVRSSEVKNDALTGADIDESTLSVDAQTLDGIDSTGFVRGGGRVLSNRVVANQFQTVSMVNVPGFVQIFFVCSNGASNNVIAYRNEGSSAIDVYLDNGSTDPTLQPIAGGDTSLFQAAALKTGEMNTFQVSGAGGQVLTAWITSAYRSTDCLANAHAILTP